MFSPGVAWYILSGKMMGIAVSLSLMLLGYPTSALERYSKEWNEAVLPKWEQYQESNGRNRIFTVDSV